MWQSSTKVSGKEDGQTHCRTETNRNIGKTKEKMIAYKCQEPNEIAVGGNVGRGENVTVNGGGKCVCAGQNGLLTLNHDQAKRFFFQEALFFS